MKNSRVNWQINSSKIDSNLIFGESYLYSTSLLQGRSCRGHEESLEECKPTNLWNHDNYCRHDEDVAVECGTGYDDDDGEVDVYREVHLDSDRK